MPLIKKEKSYEVLREGQDTILKVNAVSWNYTPNIENNQLIMARIIDLLVENPNVTRIIFTQRRNYIYNYEQTQMLLEIANVYNHLSKQRNFLTLGIINRGLMFERLYSGWRVTLQNIVINLLRQDPIGAYVEIIRMVREEKINLEKTEQLEEAQVRTAYIDLLNNIRRLLEGTKLINQSKPYLAGYSTGQDRQLYRLFFRPEITPDFMFTRLMAEPPLEAEELDIYKIDKDTEVNVYKIPGDIKPLYHLTPPEFKLDEDRYELLDLARQALIEHKPTKEEFTDPEKMRQTFFNIGRDLIQELAQHKGLQLSLKESEDLANILVRYTVGFGLIEVLLQDQKVQDVSINGPIGETPIFIVHQDYDECVTNIIPSLEDGESWASKFRLLSGRPLDEANPILDTELVLRNARARVSVISRPLNPHGLAFAFRRHRDNPWTYPLFVKNRMINPLAAGLLSFLIDGARTLLFAGTRSSGKTSLLGSTLVEIMRKYRVIVVEDTQELPVDALRKLGYNVQAMKVRSALAHSSSELGADEGIRTSLRLGDSSLIVGEIRSIEAQALYEAMRIGALANVVAGTIHGADPYSVYDRVVNDLKVPKTSFKATDIIVISNPVRSADSLHKFRRVLQITEVRKHWKDDPLEENGFVNLMAYDTKEDTLKPTQDLINGDSEILKDIAGNIREYVGNWDAVWENILLRARMKEALVKYALKTKQDWLLEAKFTVQSNDVFHQISDEVKEEVGSVDNKRVFFQWDDWVKRVIKQKQL
ncbi:MAG: type II/IV secretion system ATPase subunit [Nanoarchaeota archaeon]